MVTVDEAKQMVVSSLKDELKKRGASTQGKKAELLERLIGLIQEEAGSATEKESLYFAEDGSSSTIPHCSPMPKIPEDNLVGNDAQKGHIEENSDKVLLDQREDHSVDALPKIEGHEEQRENTQVESHENTSSKKELPVSENTKLEPAMDVENTVNNPIKSKTPNDESNMRTVPESNSEMDHPSTNDRKENNTNLVEVDNPTTIVPEEIRKEENIPSHIDTKSEAGTINPEASLSLNERIKQNILKKRKSEEDINTPKASEKSSLSIKAKATHPDEQEKTRHVRIDNFQRPLNLKNLVKWLSETTELPITEEMIWINSIKTHCYVDFSTIPDAEQCIAKVTGLKFPTTSTAILSAHFTKVSVAEAPTSAEAAMKPGEWRKHRISKESNHRDAEGNLTTIGKRKAEEAKLSAGGNLFKRVAVTALQGNNNPTTPRGTIHQSNSTTESTHKLQQPSGNSFAQDFAETPQLEKMDTSSNQIISLDELFRKTKALPAIYWLPVSEDVAERRKNLHSRLGKR